MEIKNQTRRFIELEGLRGLAAIVVVLHHFIFMFYTPLNTGQLEADNVAFPFQSQIYGTPLALPFAGTLAVAIFFMLSGFVLSIGFFQTGNMKLITKLASTRYLRLIVPAFVSVLIGYCLVKLGFNNVVAQTTAIAGAGSRYETALAFDANLFEAIRVGLIDLIISTERIEYNTVLWTMFVEFWGSFMIFALLLFFGKSRYRWVAYTGLAALTFDTWFLPFVIGTVVADLYANGVIEKLKNRISAIGFFIGAIAFGSYPHGRVEGTVYEQFGFMQAIVPGLDTKMLFLTIASLMLLMAVLTSGKLSTLLSRVGWLGKYTYSLYLTHKFVLFSSVCLIFLSVQSIDYNNAVLLSLVLSIPVMMLTSILFERYIDAPSIRLAKRVAAIRPDTKLLTSLLATQEPTIWKSSRVTD